MTETPDEEPPTKDVVLTCHTEGCENADVTIPMTVSDLPGLLFFCGPCGQPITDVQPATEEVTPHE